MIELLRVRDLRISFPGSGESVRAVDGVSFTIGAGEIVGIVGESGSGKTVTALSLLRLLDDTPARVDPTSAIEFDGVDVLGMEESALRRIRGAGIAMVFQDPATSLNPVLTIGTQIGEVLRAHRRASRAEARQRAIALIDQVGIPEATRRVDAFPHELSGGMQQRAMIAMAIAGEPRLLVADEPTTALDVTVQAQILDLLGTLQHDLGMAMILISHDLGVVARLAGRILVMYGGQIVEQAPMAELFAAPLHPYTDGLLKATPRLDQTVDRLPVIPGGVPTASRWPAGCRFHPRCRHAWDRCAATLPPLLDPPVEGVEGKPSRRSARCWLLDEPERRTP